MPWNKRTFPRYKNFLIFYTVFIKVFLETFIFFTHFSLKFSGKLKIDTQEVYWILFQRPRRDTGPKSAKPNITGFRKLYYRFLTRISESIFMKESKMAWGQTSRHWENFSPVMITGFDWNFSQKSEMVFQKFDRFAFIMSEVQNGPMVAQNNISEMKLFCGTWK